MLTVRATIMQTRSADPLEILTGPGSTCPWSGEPLARIDAVTVPLDGLGVDPDLDGPDRTFEKLVRLADPADITQVWVAGQVRVNLSA